MDLELKFLEETDLIAISSSLFKWVESFSDDKMDQVMDSIIHFDNEFDDETTIVFATMGEIPEYFKMNVGKGLIELDGDVERDMFVIDELERIEIDEFLDNVLVGNQIIKNSETKRILLKYSVL
jgi:hypothetical protein